jgi:hypothetical protein
MSRVTITVDGTDRTSQLVSLERRDEYCDPGQKFVAEFDTNFTALPWEQVVIHEDSTKVFTGWSGQIDASYDQGGVVQLTIRGEDDLKRLKEYFVAEDYETTGEGIQHWITLIAGLAGCTVQYTTAHDPKPLEGMQLGRKYAIEIIEEFLLFAGLDIWCNADGVVQVGLRMTDTSPTEAISAGTNLVSMRRNRDSEPARNAATVYAAVGQASVERTFGWEIDANDIRRMVVATMYAKNPGEAAELANRMVSIAGPEYDIKRCDLDDVYVGIEVGDRATFDDGEGNSGTDEVTTVITYHSPSDRGHYMHVVLGERCHKVGAVGPYIDGRDIIVATYECGVWRCYDIWDGTPTWYPLNIGLEEDVMYGGDDIGSSFDCEWFIRDPENPNGLAFLVTDVGLYRTDSLETGYENWYPVKLNPDVGGVFGDATDETWHIKRVRSTVARLGAYYFAAGSTSLDVNNYERTFVGGTNDKFITMHGGDFYPWGNYGTFNPPVGPDADLRHSGLWGNCNYGHQKSVALPMWHRGAAGYTGHGQGGFAAWHRNDEGFTVSGVESSLASNGGPAYWNCRRANNDYGNYKADEIFLSPYGYDCVSPWTCFGTGSPLSPPAWYWFPVHTWALTTNGAQSWTHCPSIHIPYDQTYWQGRPTILYFIPGVWAGTVVATTAIYPLKNNTAITNLPWGGTPASCHRHQGSLATFTGNAQYVYCFSFDKPSRLAVSNNGTQTWTEKSSVPVKTSCFSGFPRDEKKLYAGRHPTLDPTGEGDESLIYVSWDRGETWHDITGDLYEKTQALGIRDGGLGASGLVTIAPRYC